MRFDASEAFLVAVSFGPATGMKADERRRPPGRNSGRADHCHAARDEQHDHLKSADAPHLELAHSWIALGVTTPDVSEFRTQAFQVAVDKARELGWIG